MFGVKEQASSQQAGGAEREQFDGGSHIMLRRDHCRLPVQNLSLPCPAEASRCEESEPAAVAAAAARGSSQSVWSYQSLCLE